MIILDIVEFVWRMLPGKERGGMVISIAGIVRTRLTALDMATSGIAPCLEEFYISDW
jgi:hypothetical protein